MKRYCIYIKILETDNWKMEQVDLSFDDMKYYIEYYLFKGFIVCVRLQTQKDLTPNNKFN